MSRVRGILDNLNDLEATIARVGRGATTENALAYELTLQSLENRREDLRRELADATKHEFVDVCDYRIIPDDADSYPLSAVTSVLHDFQDLVTIVFDAITNKPRRRAVYDAETIEKTQFGFGFAYSGSLGVVLTIENERLLAIESDLDRAIASVFDLLKVHTPDNIHEASLLFGTPAVRKLYSLSRMHRDYGMSAEIKWVRDASVRGSVLAQPQEFAQVCQAIEAKGDVEIEPVNLIGTLAAWDTVSRRFILLFPEADPIRGYFAKELDASLPRTVQRRYETNLLKRTAFNYMADKEEISWELTSLSELN